MLVSADGGVIRKARCVESLAHVQAVMCRSSQSNGWYDAAHRPSRLVTDGDAVVPVLALLAGLNGQDAARRIEQWMENQLSGLMAVEGMLEATADAFISTRADSHPLKATMKIITHIAQMLVSVVRAATRHVIPTLSS